MYTFFYAKVSYKSKGHVAVTEKEKTVLQHAISAPALSPMPYPRHERSTLLNYESVWQS